MSDTADKKKVLWEHRWLFVIIPVTPVTYSPSAGETAPVLCAYCKTCDTYYTKELHMQHTGSAGLPKYGCVGPEDL